MTFSIKVENSNPSDAERAKNEAEQDHSKLDDEIFKRFNKKKLKEKFEKTELAAGFINAIPPQTRKLMERFGDVSKLVDVIQTSLQSAKNNFIETDGSKVPEAYLSTGNPDGDSHESSEQVNVAQSVYDAGIRHQLFSLGPVSDPSSVKTQDKQQDAVPKQVRNETPIQFPGQIQPETQALYQSQPVAQTVDQLQSDAQLQQSDSQQSQNQTQIQIQPNSTQDSGRPAANDVADTQQSQQSTQWQSFIDKTNSTSMRGDRNLTQSSKISNANAAETSLSLNSGKAGSVDPKEVVASVGKKTEDQDQAREAVQSMTQKMQINENRAPVHRDAPPFASNAQQHIDQMNAKLAEQNNSKPEGIKFNFDSWGNGQSVQITGTTQKGYTLQGSDAQVQQILLQHVDDSLSISLDSDGLSRDLKDADADGREKSEKRDA